MWHPTNIFLNGHFNDFCPIVVSLQHKIYFKKCNFWLGVRSFRPWYLGHFLLDFNKWDVKRKSKVNKQSVYFIFYTQLRGLFAITITIQLATFLFWLVSKVVNYMNLIVILLSFTSHPDADWLNKHKFLSFQPMGSLFSWDKILIGSWRPQKWQSRNISHLRHHSSISSILLIHLWPSAAAWSKLAKIKVLFHRQFLENILAASQPDRNWQYNR